MATDATVILYRPVRPLELELIASVRAG